MRFLQLLILCLVACTPVVLSPASPTPSAIASATGPSVSSPTTTTATASPNAPTGPQRSVVTFYRTDDVIRGSASPSKRLDVSVPVYGMRFGPDPRWAIVSNVAEPSTLRLLDLDSGVISSVALGLASDALLISSLASWLPDGRLLVTGREIWVGGARGENLRSVFAMFPFEVVPSRSGRQLAITTLDRSAITLLDLASGTAKTLTQPFRPCVQDGGVWIVWAPDDRTLAATDCTDQG